MPSYRAVDDEALTAPPEARPGSPAAREPAHALVAVGAPRCPHYRYRHAGRRSAAEVTPLSAVRGTLVVPGSDAMFGSSRHPRDSALPHQPQGRKGKSLERETSVTQASLPRSAPHSIEPSSGRQNPLSDSPEGFGMSATHPTPPTSRTRHILTRTGGAPPSVRARACADKSALQRTPL